MTGESISVKQKRICREGLAIVVDSKIVNREVENIARDYQQKLKRKIVPYSDYMDSLDFLKRMVENYPAFANKIKL